LGDDNNSAGKPALNLTGDNHLNIRAEVESVVMKFVEALKIDDACMVPLSEHVEYHGLFSPAPICGEPDVREHRSC
jgi:hypothetical protein